MLMEWTFFRLTNMSKVPTTPGMPALAIKLALILLLIVQRKPDKLLYDMWSRDRSDGLVYGTAG